MNRRFEPSRAIAGTLLAFLVALAVTACHGGAKPSDGGDDDASSTPVAVSTVPVRATDVPMRVEGFGSLVAPPSGVAAVASVTGGRITRVLAHLGDHVQRGQLLLELQPDPAAASDLAKARIAYAQARRAADRQRALVAAGVAPRMAAQQATSDLDAAQADLTAKQRAFQLSTSSTRLVAPITGVVTASSASLGLVVAPQAQVMTISDLTRSWAQVEMPPEAMASVRVGLPAVVQITGNASVAGRVVALDRQVDPATQRARLRIALDSMPPAAAEGTFVRASVVTGHAQRLLVPNAAVVMINGEPAVYVVGKDKAHQRQVTLGERVGDDVVVKSGLKPGEPVAVKGAYELTDGATVTTGDKAASGASAAKQAN